MKIDKLYTLSQFVDIVAENNNDEFTNKKVIEHAENNMETDLVVCAVAELVANYNEFLKQPITKEMFINSIKFPGEYEGDPNNKAMVNFHNKKTRRWLSSENKVIFEGFNKSKIGNWLFQFGSGEYTTLLSFETNNSFGSTKEIITLSDLAEVTKGELTLKNLEI